MWTDAQKALASLAVCALFCPALHAEAPQAQLIANRKGGDVAVSLYIDKGANGSFRTDQAGYGVEGMVYGIGNASPQAIPVEPTNDHLMALWKGNAVVSPEPTGKGDNAIYWWTLEPAQFAPVFLVVEAVNNGARSTKVTGAYLDVEESDTDNEPFLTISPVDFCGGEVSDTGGPIPRFQPVFQLVNFGWGAVEDAKVKYVFGNKTATDHTMFEASIGSFGKRTNVSVSSGLNAMGLQVNRVTTEKFPCADNTDVAACLKDLSRTGIFGRLSNSVFADWSTVNTRVSGTIEYAWTDARGMPHSRASPFSVDIPLLAFNYTGPECGGAGPVERGFKTVKLSLDRNNYRIPLPFKGRLARKQNRRFSLSLVADKSSQHVFKVVLQLADGTTVSSPTVDLLYFMPN